MTLTGVEGATIAADALRCVRRDLVAHLLRPDEGRKRLKRIALADGIGGFTLLEGREFPGAQGTLTAGPAHDKQAARLTADFTGGGRYVAMQMTGQHLLDAEALHLDVHSSNLVACGVRILDGSGQWHSWRLPLAGTGWQQLRLDLADSQGHWGGANDGVIHQPITGLCLLIPADGLTQTGKPAVLHCAGLEVLGGSAVRRLIDSQPDQAK